jgi:trk system potassium uptake protein TrkH
VQRLAPRIVETARRLWIVYVLLTAVEVLLLYSLHLGGLAPQMDLFNSFAHGFTTMPTGGFSPEARSIEAFTPAVQWAIIPFMFFAGTNFALLWQVGTDNPGILFDDIEFKAYFGILFVFSAVLSLVVFLDVQGQTIFSSIRHGIFQVLTIVTTTGYASTDFNQWSGMAMTLMFLGMFIGGCAGSTGGGIKIIRWVVGVKEMHRELYTTVHPRSVRPVRMGKRVLDDRTTRTIIMLILFYFFLFLVSSSLIYLDEIRVGDHRNPLEVMSTAAACLGNIGPGFGAVGPMNNYTLYSPITKLILFVLMWFGRLEIISAIVLFTPVYWFR